LTEATSESRASNQVGAALTDPETGAGVGVGVAWKRAGVGAAWTGVEVGAAWTVWETGAEVETAWTVSTSAWSRKKGLSKDC